MSSDIKLRILRRDDIPAWNRYVCSAPNGTVFHRAEWKAIFEEWLGHVAFCLLAKSVEECMKSIPRKQRAMVRKGIGHSLKSQIEDHLDSFYPIFSESYRNLGTPVLSRDYCEAIKDGLVARIVKF